MKGEDLIIMKTLVASAPKETLQSLCLKIDEEIQCLLCWCIFPSKIALPVF